MYHSRVVLACSLTLIAALMTIFVGHSRAAAPKGAVIAIGAGPFPGAVYKRAFALAGKKHPRVVVFPQASGSKKGGARDAARFTKRGAASAVVVDTDDVAAAHAAVKKADIVFFGGGAQLRLMEALNRAKLVPALRKRFRAGAVIMGVSAGAAVLSRVMLSGRPKPKALRKGAMKAYRGIGVLRDFIIDQHFVQLRRLGRLTTAVLDHPKLVGVGVCERTAAVFAHGRIEVMGPGQVVIIDARKALVFPAKRRGRQAAKGVTIHVLRQGMAPFKP